MAVQGALFMHMIPQQSGMEKAIAQGHADQPDDP